MNLRRFCVKYLPLIFDQVPRLLKASFIQKRLDLLVLALELAVPPLSALILLWLTTTIIAFLATIFSDSWIPLVILAIEGIFITFSILGSWLKFGRTAMPGMMILAIPLYIFWKLPIYFKFLLTPQISWNRTERDILPSR